MRLLNRAALEPGGLDDSRRMREQVTRERWLVLEPFRRWSRPPYHGKALDIDIDIGISIDIDTDIDIDRVRSWLMGVATLGPGGSGRWDGG